MAIKIKKRVPKPESDEPELLDAEGNEGDGFGSEMMGDTEPVAPAMDDPLDDIFLSTADQSLSWATQNRTLVIGAVAVVLLLVVGAAVFVQQQQAGREAISQTLTEALDVMAAPVGDEKVPTLNPTPNVPEPAEKGPRFDTSKAKYEQLGAKADTVLSQHSGSSASGFAHLMKARASFELGKYDEAIASYQSWLSQNDNASEKPFVLQALANAQASGGKADDAVATLDKLKSINADVYGPTASYQKGQVWEQAGNKDKAKAAYEELLKSHPDSDPVELARMRLDLL